MEDRRHGDTLLLEQIRSLKELIEERFDRNEEGHNLLIAQTTKTNGRVTKLEAWKNLATGGFFVVQLFVIPILLWLVYAHLDKSK